MRRSRLSSWASAVLVIGSASGAARGLAAERAFQVAPGAWSLEEFGADVAVLRSSPAADRSGNVSLLLACSANDRRIRFTFPADLLTRSAGDQTVGSALITAVGPSRTRAGLVLRFQVTDPATLVVGASLQRRDDPVARLATMLAAGAPNLDLLVSWGSAPVQLTRLTVYRLSMHGAEPNKGDVTHFIAACRRPMPQRDH